jgi:hypothetical protein
MKLKGFPIFILAVFGLLCADILVLDKGPALYRDSLLTQQAPLPLGAGDSVVPIHSETKRAYVVEFKDSLFLDSVIGYVGADYAKNKNHLQFYDLAVQATNMRFSSNFKIKYRAFRRINIAVNRRSYVALVRRGTGDTSFISFNTYRRISAIYRQADSLKAVADKIHVKSRRRKIIRELVEVESAEFPVKGIRVALLEKKAVNNPDWTCLSVERKNYFKDATKKEYYRAKYYVRGRDVLYWIKKSDGLRTYRSFEAYLAHVRDVESRKQYVKKHRVAGPKARAILSGQIVRDMTESDVVASIGSPTRKTPRAERFGAVRQIWFYPKYKLHFLDGKLVKWE